MKNKRKTILVLLVLMIIFSFNTALCHDSTYTDSTDRILHKNHFNTTDTTDTLKVLNNFLYHRYFYFLSNTDSLAKPDTTVVDPDQENTSGKYIINETKIFIGNDGQIYTL